MDTTSLGIALAALSKANKTSLYHFKGSVEDQSQLPASASEGDVYYAIKENTNFAWNGTNWNDIGKIGGVNDFNQLSNKPKVNNTELVGNKTGSDLGLIDKQQDPKESGKVLSINDEGIVEPREMSGGYEPNEDKGLQLDKQDKLCVKVDNNTIVFDESGNLKSLGGEKSNSYISIEKIRDYAYETLYANIDYEKAKEHYAKGKPTALTRIGKPTKKYAGCNAFFKNGIVGRTYDWFYNNDAEFVVKTPARDGLYAVQGVAMQRGLTDAIVKSGAYNELFDIMPFALCDGINSEGLFVASLIVPNDKGITMGTTPRVEQVDEICSIMLPRYILEHSSRVSYAVNDLLNYISVYNHADLIGMGYEIHYFMADKTGYCGVLEFVNNEIVFHETNKITNFYYDGVSFNEDGSVYTPYDVSQDSTHDPIEVNFLTDFASGVERYNLINRNLPSATTMLHFKQILLQLLYTNAYKRSTDPFWYSELVGGDYKVNTPASDYEKGGVVDSAIRDFEGRSREVENTWQTAHGGVYNLIDGTMSLCFQEDIDTMKDFRLNYYTKENVDELVNEVKVPIIELTSTGDFEFEPLSIAELSLIREKNGEVRLLAEGNVARFVAYQSGSYVYSLAMAGDVGAIVSIYVDENTGAIETKYIEAGSGGDTSGCLRYNTKQSLNDEEISNVGHNTDLGYGKDTKEFHTTFVSGKGFESAWSENKYIIPLAKQEQIVDGAVYSIEIVMNDTPYTITGTAKGTEIICMTSVGDFFGVDTISETNINEITIFTSHERETPNITALTIEGVIREVNYTPIKSEYLPNNFSNESLETNAKNFVDAINEVNGKHLFLHNIVFNDPSYVGSFVFYNMQILSSNGERMNKNAIAHYLFSNGFNRQDIRNTYQLYRYHNNGENEYWYIGICCEDQTLGSEKFYIITHDNSIKATCYMRDETITDTVVQIF